MSESMKTFLRTYFAVGIAISALAIYQTEQQTQALLEIRTGDRWVGVMLIFSLNIVGGVYLLFHPEALSSFWPKIKFDPSKIAWKLLGLGLILAAFPLLWTVKYDFFGRAGAGFFAVVWVWWWLVLIQAAGIRLLARASLGASFTSSLLADGVIFQTYVIFQGLSDYPFSLGWSEASGYYYGSLLFSRSLYGEQLPLSIWHATRYFLLAIPFLLRGLPLWADRLWQALLWFGLTGLTSWSFTRRLRLGEREQNLFLLAWLFLFLFQGAVYYHLQICIIIIFLGVSARHPGRSLAAVIVASFWAGMSRLNWFPVPAMLALTLYLLEEPLSGARRVRDYFVRPLLWSGLGLAAALAGQVFYFFISGDTDLTAFHSTFHSPLLLDPWLPNQANPFGLLL